MSVSHDYWNVPAALSARHITPDHEALVRFFDAMLWRAVEDYELALDYLQGFSRDYRIARLYQRVDELESWFFDDNGYVEYDKGLSLNFICDGLNIVANSVRLQVTRWRHERIQTGRQIQFSELRRPTVVRPTKQRSV